MFPAIEAEVNAKVETYGQATDTLNASNPEAQGQALAACLYFVGHQVSRGMVEDKLHRKVGGIHRHYTIARAAHKGVPPPPLPSETSYASESRFGTWEEAFTQAPLTHMAKYCHWVRVHTREPEPAAKLAAGEVASVVRRIRKLEAEGQPRKGIKPFNAGALVSLCMSGGILTAEQVVFSPAAVTEGEQVGQEPAPEQVPAEQAA